MLTCAKHDNAIRWRPGERLEHLFEERCDRLAGVGNDNHPAVVGEDAILSYRELDNRANQLARYLGQRGVGAGDRIGLLFDKSVQTYVALLAVLKLGGAYVPLDPSFPKERIDFIAEDAALSALVTLSNLCCNVQPTGLNLVALDEEAEAIAAQSPQRLGTVSGDELCYIIYTSGTTGRPKGVAVEHPSICNFVRVASDVYGYTENDRVYQGMTIAFDFSVEELWVPLISGATLVPAKAGMKMVGDELADFLAANDVTAICCVPTLLETIDRDLPNLRFLLVSGETCPQDLVTRWHHPGRRILNAYGPTEATVTATWAELKPDKPVTIGGPLPTYTVVILDEQHDVEVPAGGTGEIGIAGIGLARGYLNRPDLTDRCFVPDFLQLPDNPAQRIYRTGDLGRINESGEIEFLGRIDTQVKIRGYRIELSEIEAVLLELPGIAQAVVDTYEETRGNPELVAYYTLKTGATEPDRDVFADLLKSRLPRYMIPAYVEKLAAIPMLPSHKADRKNLPPPKGARFAAGSKPFVAPTPGMQREIASALAETLKLDKISAVDDFFLDLGAHSLLMARLCAEIRQRLPQIDVSMRDIYLNPTVTQLAEALSKQPVCEAQEAAPEPYRVPPTWHYYVCGTAQALYYGAMTVLGMGLLYAGLVWISNASSLWDYYVHAVSFTAAMFVIATVMPILAKWVLIGRWREERIPIWGLRYFRFWVVKNLTRMSPLVLFRGSPLFNIYLRLLGAKIGRHAVLHLGVTPVCTDLICIGDDTVVRKDSMLLGYKAQGNYIHTGRVTIGNNAFVGESTTLDIGTVMEDDTQLGHSSSLHQGQVVPAGRRFHGSPGQETTTEYCRVEARRCTSLRRALYSVFVMLLPGLAVAPLPLLLIRYLFVASSDAGGITITTAILDVTTLPPVIDIMVISAVWFYGLFLLGLILVALVPRLFNLFLREDKPYVLFGFHHFLFGIVATSSNSYFHNLLIGDSSLIVHYLRMVGWKLSDVVQTGSNFGANQKHTTPFLCHVGRGTMVSDGLSIINHQMSSSSFELRRVSIGADNFLGNNVRVPPDSKAGDNCLLATKVMVPIDGPMRQDTGLLGSPPFTIPRVVDQDQPIRRYDDPQVRSRRIFRKNLYNGATMLSYLFANWLFFFVFLLTIDTATGFYHAHGAVIIPLTLAFLTLFAIGYFILVEWVGLGFRRMQPRFVSIYDPYYWFHERYWKFSDSFLRHAFKGTPFRNLVIRLAGARVGRKVFDDGCYYVEKTLTKVGDYCCLNEWSVLQGHSMEEGIFKSDRIEIGKGCSIAPVAFVHYGVRMGDNVVLGPDSFLMKGEVLASDTCWHGNPARQASGGPR